MLEFYDSLNKVRYYKREDFSSEKPYQIWLENTLYSASEDEDERNDKFQKLYAEIMEEIRALGKRKGGLNG